MKCWIYRGTLHAETYLYLLREDDTTAVPPPLLERLGPLRLVMELELSADRTLARANPAEVIESLHSRGYYLQMPPPPPTPGAERVQ